MKRSVRVLRHPTILLLPAAMIPVGASWIADGIVSVFSGQGWQPGVSAIGAALFVIGSVWLWRARRTLLGVQTLQEGGTPKPHRVLVANLSPSSFAVDDRGLAVEGSLYDHTPDLPALIEALGKTKWNGAMLLRAIAHHLASLERLHLLATAKITPDARHAWNTLLRRYCPKVQIAWHDIHDSESLDQYRQTVNRICEKALKNGFSAQDIIIDVTGGQKVASIGTAAATLENPALEFQYVSTETPEVIKSYNAQTVHQEIPA